MLRKGILLVLACFMCSPLVSQRRKKKKEKSNYENFAYLKAINEYEELVSTSPSIENYAKLGDCYFFNKKFEAAANAYGKLFNIYKKKKITPEYYFKYAQALRGAGKYIISDTWMEKFNQVKPEDTRGINFVTDQYQLNYLLHANVFEIENAHTINTELSDFVSGEIAGKLIIASPSKVHQKKYSWNEQAFLDLYQVDKGLIENEILQKIRGFPKTINTELHESSIAVSEDQQTMYFTRNSKMNDETGLSNLKIFKATKNENKQWDNIEELPFNDTTFSNAHPCLSKDGKRLYFTSNRPESIGSSDIYYVDILGENQYGKVTNLGNHINTEGKEMFPYVDQEGNLYFASDGHYGLGGLDLFIVKNNEENVINLGAPINSSFDDFAIVFNNETKTGYISSNRVGGIGDDDIYSIKQIGELKEFNNCVVFGRVLDEKNKQPIPGTIITVYDNQQNIIDQLPLGEDAEFSFSLTCNTDYTFKATNDVYETYSLELPLTRKTASKEYVLNMKLKETFKKNTKGNILVKINPIYFSYGKHYIRKDATKELNKIVEVMNKYPNMVILSTSHTDSKGKDEFNLNLSEKRANSTADYIISQGISSSRIYAKGYGETRLVNKCLNNVKCTDEEHELNRRTEFLVVDAFNAQKILGDAFVGINTSDIFKTDIKKYHTVAKEDTLYNIANRYNQSVDNLKKLNNLDSNLIYIGQMLVIGH